jgi:hypothetical protein
MIRFVIIALAILVLYAFVHCAQADQNQFQKIPKWGWLLLIAIPFFQPFGAISYLIWGRPKNQGPGRSGKRKIIGPDDDPDFLRNL